MSRRIRTIKPEITKSKSLARCSIQARLAFVYLLTNADDEGRMRGHSRMLGRTLFPYDDVEDHFGDWLRELEGQNAIEFYEVDGSQFLQIVN